MALAQADRVRETSVTSGTGTLNLDGAVTSFKTFVSGIGTTNECYYTITATNGDWEVGRGVVTSGAPDTLSRVTVLANSLGTQALISFDGSSKDVFTTIPAEDFVFGDGGTAAIEWDGSNNQLRVGHRVTEIVQQKVMFSTEFEEGLQLRSSRADAFGGGLSVVKARGTPAAPATFQDDDEMGRITFNGFIATLGGDKLSQLARITVLADGVPASGDAPGRMEFFTTPSGSATPLLRMTIFQDGVVDFAQPIQLQRFAVASLPAVTTDRMIIVNDETGGLVPAFSDGTNWRRVTDRNIVA